MRSEWLKIRRMTNFISSVFGVMVIGYGGSDLYARATHFAYSWSEVYASYGPTLITAVCFIFVGFGVIGTIWRKGDFSNIFYALAIIIIVYTSFFISAILPDDLAFRRAYIDAMFLPLNVGFSLAIMSLCNMYINYTFEKHIEKVNNAYMVALWVNLATLVYAFLTLSYVDGQIRPHFEYTSLLEMSFSNGAGIILLAIGNLVFLCNRSFIFNNKNRSLVPVVIFTICVGFVVLAWKTTSIKEQFNFERDRDQVAVNVEMRLNQFVSNELDAINWLGDLIQNKNHLPPIEVIKEVQGYIDKIPALSGVGIIERNRENHWLALKGDLDKASYFDLVDTNKVEMYFDGELNVPAMKLIAQKNNQSVLYYYFPLHSQSRKLERLLVGVVDFEKLLHKLLQPYLKDDYQISLQNRGNLIYNSVTGDLNQERMEYSKVVLVNILGSQWSIRVVPTQSIIAYYGSWVFYFILVVVLIFSNLIAYVLKILRMLQEEDQTNYMILHCAGEGIFGLNKDGKVTFINPAGTQMLGWSFDELRGKSIHDVVHPMHLDKTPYELTETPIYKTSIDGNIREVEDELFTRKDGTTFEVEYQSRPLKDLSGHLRGVVVTLKDISKRRELEKKLADTNKELMNLSRSAGISEVTSGVLHNLGNILNNVNISFQWLSTKLNELKYKKMIQVLKMIQDQSLKEDKRQVCIAYLSQALEQDKLVVDSGLSEVKKMEDLIEHAKNVLHTQQAYSKIVNFNEEVDIKQVIYDAVALSYLKESVQFRFDFHNIEKICVDKHKVIQIILNLIKNAYNAMFEADVENPVITIECKKDHNQIRIKVKDNGPGVPSSLDGKLFAFGATSRKDGHGFGLHHSANLATELKGKLFLEKTQSPGACFVLDLPTANG